MCRDWVYRQITNNNYNHVNYNNYNNHVKIKQNVSVKEKKKKCEEAEINKLNLTRQNENTRMCVNYFYF